MEILIIIVTIAVSIGSIVVMWKRSCCHIRKSEERKLLREEERQAFEERCHSIRKQYFD